MFIVFRNPGIIDLAAVTIMGVSVKEEGSFGRFGTGLKYSISTILRGGGHISIWRDGEEHILDTAPRSIRGVDFDVVHLDGEPLGFTTALGRDWEPWMVLRELACNAMDEGGTFGTVEEGDENQTPPEPGETVIQVSWDKLEEAYARRDELFAEGEPLAETPSIRALAGPSDFMYYRHVRVRKLDKPAAFRWDILAEQPLTEDRTLTTTWHADTHIMTLAMTTEDPDIINGIICAGKETHEGQLNFVRMADSLVPSRQFIDAVFSARDRRDRDLNDTAHALVLKHVRKNSEDRATYVSSRRVDDPFSRAVEQLERMGIEFTDKPVVMVDELEDKAALHIVADGRIYVLRSLFRQSDRVIVKTLLLAHLEAEVWSVEQAFDILGKALFEAHQLSWEEPAKGSGAAREEAMQVAEADLVNPDDITAAPPSVPTLEDMPF